MVILLLQISDCAGSEQTRFEDHCFEYASDSTPTDIISNIDACKEKGSELWVPESSAEHFFVHQSFPGAAITDEIYHLGISKYENDEGFKGVDHSFYVGSAYFSLDSDVNDQEGDFIKNGRCLVFNKATKIWERQDPCDNAIGVCKRKLGMVLGLYILQRY